MEAIRYGSFRIGDNVNLIINPNIPSHYMLMYINLIINKVNVVPYINENWHSKGFFSDKLYYVILAHSKGYDISDLSPNMSVEDIKKTLSEMVESTEIDYMLSNSNLSEEEILKIKSFDPIISKFLLRISKDNNISDFLNLPLQSFDINQVKYLFTVYQTGGNVSSILNPELTVEQMKEKILNSKHSSQFLQEIMENHEARKR